MGKQKKKDETFNHHHNEFIHIDSFISGEWTHMEKEQLGYKWTIFDTLDIMNITINKMPIVTELDSLLKYFGKPNSTFEGGKFFKEGVNYRNFKDKERIKYQAYFYNGLRFAVWNNQVRLNEVELINTNLVLSTPYGTFSNKTTEEELIKLFPKSYDWRQSGLCGIFDGYKGITDQDFKNGRIDWLFVHNGIGEDNWMIEFILIDKKLAYIFIDNIEIGRASCRERV